MTNRVGDDLIHFGGNEPLVRALVVSGVRFIVIGGLGVSWHCPARTADDMDLLIGPGSDNAENVALALGQVGIPLASAEPFTQAGKQLPLKAASFYAELLTQRADGISYAEADADALAGKLFGIPVRIASVATLTRMKRHAADTTTGTEREKHLADLRLLDDAAE